MFCVTRIWQSSSKVSNNAKNTSSTQESKSNERIATLECDKSPLIISNNSKNTSSTQELRIKWMYCDTRMW